MAHTGHIVEEGYALYAAKGGAVFDGDLVAGFDSSIYLPQIE